MFDCDVAPEFYTWSEPVARKEHECCECSAPILNGEKHFCGRGKWEGKIDTYRQHMLCCEACMWVRDKIEDECIPFGALQVWYGEYAHEALSGRRPDETRELIRMMVKIRRRERKGI